MCAQGFSQELSQRQTQNLVLAPQLRQSLKILQVAALDLRTAIQEELQSNPTLEEMPLEMISIEEKSDNGEPEETEGNREELEFDESFAILNKLNDEWRDHMAEMGGTSFTREDADRRQHFFDSLVTETSLQEHLIQQADMIDLTNKQKEAMQYLVGSLDGHGFLTSSLPDIALMADLPLSTIQEAHQTLLTFDPPGIGCADLRDSLLQQLKVKGRSTSVAARIAKDHFDLLARRRIPDIARRMGLPVEEIQKALKEISLLDPAPGRKFADDSNRVVVPDVIVTKDDDEWKIELNSDYIPRLRLSQSYKDLIAKGKLSKQEKEYLQEKLRSGKFLISSIEQRQQTIEKITREILRVQIDFFEEGVSKLHPLTMTQVAEVVGVHETTVSRAIANKYIQTPHGVFEIKYFFTPGYRSGDGEAVSNTSVKDMIAGLVQAEDTTHPLSDQGIVRKLAEREIKIARRTVAKYREELGILPSNLRRQYE
ncbi:MAG: RNA polymerase sigma-54 factor [Verrucomicrobia bacterium]|nr:MAG: RNA polymerase sigma-54 factor [Verrucomicrobiota bacterium]